MSGSGNKARGVIARPELYEYERIQARWEFKRWSFWIVVMCVISVLGAAIARVLM